MKNFPDLEDRVRFEKGDRWVVGTVVRVREDCGSFDVIVNGQTFVTYVSIDSNWKLIS